VSDDMTVQPGSDPVATAPAAPPKAGGLKGFFATTLGKVVIIGLAVTVLLTVLAVVAVIVLGAVGVSLYGDVVQQLPATVPKPSGSAPAAQAASQTVPAVAVVGLDEVFSPRDPFQPVILPASALDGEDDENTLTLIEIVEENGDLKAVLKLGVNKYTLGSAETIPNTPWQVVSVGSSSVVMLYGDTQITLSIGQGISMK
jgi:hypothetical protein